MEGHFHSRVAWLPLGRCSQTRAFSAVSRRELSGDLTCGAHRQRADFSDKVQTPPSACILGGVHFARWGGVVAILNIAGESATLTRRKARSNGLGGGVVHDADGGVEVPTCTTYLIQTYFVLLYLWKL